MHDLTAADPGETKVVFLDRDGVINRDSPDYIKGYHEFEFLPGSLTALHALHSAGYATIVVTNQSAVRRGLISTAKLQQLHQRMVRAVEQNGGRITDVFYCPHHPDDHCDCRKPKTGLIRQALTKYPINIGTATMIGDSVKDMEFALNAGCGRRVLVLTGNGSRAAAELRRRGFFVDALAKDLSEAVEWIIARDRICDSAQPSP